jgi:hypothetical protein
MGSIIVYAVARALSAQARGMQPYPSVVSLGGRLAGGGPDGCQAAADWRTQGHAHPAGRVRRINRRVSCLNEVSRPPLR